MKNRGGKPLTRINRNSLCCVRDVTGPDRKGEVTTQGEIHKVSVDKDKEYPSGCVTASEKHR